MYLKNKSKNLNNVMNIFDVSIKMVAIFKLLQLMGVLNVSCSVLITIFRNIFVVETNFK